MNYVPYKKGTLLIPSGSDGKPNAKHLFVILNNKCPDGSHLLVNFSSVTDGRFHDPACMVAQGEHTFIKNESFVEYRLARIDAAEHIARCVEGWLFKPYEPVSQGLLDKICDGLVNSDFTPRRIVDYYQSLPVK